MRTDKSKTKKASARQKARIDDGECDTCGSTILLGRMPHHKTWCNDETKKASAPETRKINQLVQNPDGSPKWENPTTVMQRGDSYGIPYKRTIPAEKPTAIKTEQPHDALRQAKRDHEIGIRNIVAQRDQARAHAESLAEALRDVLPYAEGFKSSAGAIERSQQALAAWKGAKQ